MRIRIGVSTCPNDTYAFHALLTGAIDTDGLQFDFELADVEQLNRGLFAGAYDVAKASFHAAHRLADQVITLRSGSALGYGVGPVVIGRHARNPGQAVHSRVLGPGEHTTATLLYRIFHNAGEIEQVTFSEILPALERGEADLGICIHEGRFTYSELGLVLVEDLGNRWEIESDLPLPLGGILARRSLDRGVARAVDHCIRRSIEYANANPDSTLATMRRYAQAFEDDVLRKHVELYVNETTLDLGDTGRSAICALGNRGRAAGALPSGAELEFLS